MQSLMDQSFLEDAMISGDEFILPPLDTVPLHRLSTSFPIKNIVQPLPNEEDISYDDAKNAFLKLHSLCFDPQICEQALEEAVALKDARPSLIHVALKKAIEKTKIEPARNIKCKYCQCLILQINYRLIPFR